MIEKELEFIETKLFRELLSTIGYTVEHSSCEAILFGLEKCSVYVKLSYIGASSN